MEQGKQTGSSLTSDLFGAKGSSSAASYSGIFGSIFPVPGEALGEVPSPFSPTQKKKNDSGDQAWNVKTGDSDHKTLDGAELSRSMTSKSINLHFQDGDVHPFHYSSSLYYGGQDFYFQTQTTKNPESSSFNKDAGEDDSGIASRGNWWQGSLYY